MPRDVACSDPEALSRFVLGQLPGDQVERLAQHVEQCANCVVTLRKLKAEDSLSDAMHLPMELLDETQSRLVEELAKKMSALAGASRFSRVEAQQPDEIKQLGPYRILKLLGSGGMGIVYQAEDPHLQRIVALKVMKGELAKQPEARQRFLREARAVAAFNHDHILSIFQVGEDQGVPYLAMPFLEGETLADRLNCQGRLPAGEVARIGREIASGLQAAHARGLIHRDIKPANIWMESYNSTIHDSPSRVKIMDFGLARPVEADAQLTQSGMIVGTPAYMAPEQARGNNLDGRADLFSLGCLLYSACAGELPFKAQDAMSMLLAIAMDAPAPPCQVQPEVPAALSDLIMKLLARNPDDRPATAKEVADQLSIVEKQLTDLSPGTLMPRPSRRPARRLAVVAVLALLGLGYLFGGTVFRLVTDQGLVVIEVDDPETEVTVTENKAVIQDRKGQRRVTLAAGEHELEVTLRGGDGELHFFTKKFTLSRGGREIVNARQEAAREKAARPMSERRHLGHLGDFIWSVAISLDGTRCYAGSQNGRIVAWETATGNTLFTCVHDGAVRCLGVTPDGRTLVSGGHDSMRSWDALTGKELHRFKGAADLWGLNVSPDGSRVISNHPSAIWDLKTGQRLGPAPGIGYCPFLPDGTACLCANVTTLQLRSTKDGKVLRDFTFSGQWIRCIAVSPDGRYATTGHGGSGNNPARPEDDYSVRLWEVKSGRLLGRFVGFKHSVYGTGFMPDSKSFVAASLDGSIRFYDVASGTEIGRVEGLPPIYTIALSADGQSAVTGDANGDVRLWRLRDVGLRLVPETGKLDPESPAEKRIKLAHHLAKARQAHGKGLHEVAIAECGEVLRLDGRNFDGLFVRGCAFCDLGKFESMIDDLESAVRLKPNHLDSRRLLCYAYLNTGRPEQCIQVATELLRSDNMHFPNYVNRAKAYQDLRQLELALADVNKLVDASSWFWRAELHKTLGNNREAQENREKAIALDAKIAHRDLKVIPLFGILQRFAGHQGGVAWKVAFSPKGDRIYSAGADKQIHAWEIATGRIELSFAGHEAEVLAIAVSPDGKWLTSGSKDGTARVWNAVTARELRKLRERSGDCWGLAFAPDSERIVGGGGNGDAGTLQIWDVSTGKSLVRAQKQGAVADFHPDGNYFLAGTNAGLLRVFEAGTGKAVRDFAGHKHCVRRIAISPDGKLAASASSCAPLGPGQPDEETFATIWDWSTGKKRFQLNHAERVFGLAFSPGSRRVASGGLDRSVRIWDTETGKEVWHVQALSEIVDLAYSPSGMELAAACKDGMVRLWRLPAAARSAAPAETAVQPSRSQ